MRNLKTDVAGCSEMLVTVYEIKRCHILKYSNAHNSILFLFFDVTS
jgi:hypothetical protein